jgi:dephospho-CoA kinase
MPTVLITGMSGTGKSSALTELARRGHVVVDTDDVGWIVELDTPGGPEPVWDEDRMTALLDEHVDGVLFVAGCVANQARFYSRFDAVVLLSAPLEVVLARVATRTDNAFGSTAAQREKIARDLREFEPLLRARADIEIVSTVPLETVATELERVAGTSSG